MVDNRMISAANFPAGTGTRKPEQQEVGEAGLRSQSVLRYVLEVLLCFSNRVTSLEASQRI